MSVVCIKRNGQRCRKQRIVVWGSTSATAVPLQTVRGLALPSVVNPRLCVVLGGFAEDLGPTVR
jgi:hypothetical protein